MTNTSIKIPTLNFNKENYKNYKIQNLEQSTLFEKNCFSATLEIFTFVILEKFILSTERT